MLITVDKERGCDAAAPVRRRQPHPRSAPAAPPRQTTLWALATVITLIASGVAMGRIAGFDFSLGLGPLRPPQPKTLEHQLPYGKGMWIWEVDKTEAGDVNKIVARTKAVGLSHVFVRTGSTWDGFYGGPFLDRLLPVAHAAGLRVYGWDFPRLIDPQEDVRRAVAAITHETPNGKHRIDGFAPDIETRSEGTYITAEAASAYGDALRAAVQPGFPLIAVVPRPSAWTLSFYPYADIASRFDAVAPMVYWLNRQPGPDVEGALRDLKPFGKPVFPIGQAYDGAPEGGRPGVPPREELMTFVDVAHGHGASGISFWSWQAANQEAWDTIRDVHQFKASPPPWAPALLEKRAATPPPRAPLVLQAG